MARGGSFRAEELPPWVEEVLCEPRGFLRGPRRTLQDQGGFPGDEEDPPSAKEFLRAHRRSSTNRGGSSADEEDSPAVQEIPPGSWRFLLGSRRSLRQPRRISVDRGG